MPITQLSTTDIAQFGNPELTGPVPFEEYLRALENAKKLIASTAIFSGAELKAFDNFLSVSRENISRLKAQVPAWGVRGDWLEMLTRGPFVEIIQPPITGLSSGLAVIEDDEGDFRFSLIAKNVNSFLTFDNIVNFLKLARQPKNHLYILDSYLESNVQSVPKDFELILESAPSLSQEQIDELLENVDEGRISAEVAEQFMQGRSISPPFDVIRGGNLNNILSGAEFEELPSQQVANLRNFFKKLRKEINNPSAPPKPPGSGSSEIRVVGRDVEISDSADQLTEAVGRAISRYLDMNMYQLVNPLTISLGGSGADVNVSIDTSAPLRTQVRSALQQVSAPLVDELEYSEHGFDSDAFDVHLELAYFAGFN